LNNVILKKGPHLSRAKEPSDAPRSFGHGRCRRRRYAGRLASLELWTWGKGVENQEETVRT
jgi:hypothetical protein